MSSACLVPFDAATIVQFAALLGLIVSLMLRSRNDEEKLQFNN